MSQSWNINPKTGDYVMEKGAPQQTDLLTIPAYIRLKARRGGWLYAPDARWGSNLFLIKKRANSGDDSLVENTAADALQPIVDDGRALSIEVQTKERARHGVGIEIHVIDSSGNAQREIIDGLGV